MISLCTFAKNESHCIKGMFDSVSDYVREIVVVDTGSSDDTVQICKDYGARVYEVGFSDFGKIRTVAAHLATSPFILMLDCDEKLDGAHELPKLHLLLTEHIGALAFPRKRWLDLEKQHQTELSAFPDLQVRFFRNDPRYTWNRELHEYFSGCEVKHINYPIIDHYHDFFKTPKRLKERKELYTRLAAQAGVSIEGGKVL